MVLPSVLPCQCTNPQCGITFQASNPIGGGGANITFVGNITNCPRCGHAANYANWTTDSKGNFQLHGFFSALRNFQDVEKLRTLKSDLEAANDSITANELADTLIELEPSFERFKKTLSSIPANKIAPIISLLLSIITIIIMLKTWQSTEDNHNENIALQKEQQSLAREQFEYQKERDKKQDNISSLAETEKDELKKRIDLLEREFEEKLKDINERKETDPSSLSQRQGSWIKGNLRNKPCPCGSTKKAKKCHPNGYYNI